MSKIVNLRQARKQRDRAAKKLGADANAALHGRPRRQRKSDAAKKELNERRLDGHKRDDN